MDYDLERLGHGKFQKMCQSLVLEEYSDVTCYPVGKADGGRDIVVNQWMDGGESFLLYQVKFTKYPSRIEDSAEWVYNKMKSEIKKVKRLKKRGAGRYIFITNVEASANLESGERDRLKEKVEEDIDIPFACWWRNEVERRIDKSKEVKWSYPSMLSGKDVIRHLVVNEAEERGLTNRTAVRAYIANRYKNNKDIKFKQVDLRQEISRLYIDVPVYMQGKGSDARDDISDIIPDNFNGTSFEEEVEREFFGRSRIGAIELLTEKGICDNVDKFVLEGGPGQGKSTIVQYLAQIFRAKLLNKDTGRINDDFLNSISFIPFEIELRDYANWINGENPFANSLNMEDWNPSVESFLSHQVSFRSGGTQFDVEDLHSVMSVSPVILIFDGLDEIADIEVRRDAVNRIQSGVDRLSEIASTLLTVVTSRPAAFSNSPGMPRSEFTYLQLDSVTRPLIDSYASKWMQAKGLEERQKKELKKTIDEKLQEPHLRELARNPMQLAILLNLIYMRGSSLPDARTALYDRYIEHFLDRESEKSEIIRSNRELIYELHCYIAWVLHSEAETGRSSGQLMEEELNNLISEYLDDKGHNKRLVDDLFKGMVQRVVALVSRVEGTYEFEVQPLREFFTAKYLYESAPYSPTGEPKPGTKPERFAAICRNFYWLNVTRFFAGCLDRAELPFLENELKSFCYSEEFGNISYPRRLIIKLLSDRVFKQSPKVRSRVTDLLTENNGLYFLICSSETDPFTSESEIDLPKGEGREKLWKACFDLLEDRPNKDAALDIIDIINNNASEEDRLKYWKSQISRMEGESKAVWLNYAYQMDILDNISQESLMSLCDNDIDSKDMRSVLFFSGREDVMSSDETISNNVVDDILGLEYSPSGHQVDNIYRVLYETHNPSRYGMILDQDVDAKLIEYFKVISNRRKKYDLPDPSSVDFDSVGKLLDFGEFYDEVYSLFSRSGSEWSTSIAPWDSFLQYSRNTFGLNSIHLVLSCLGAGIQSSTETCVDASEMFDESTSICSRARYARLRAGDPKWWQRTFDDADDESDRLFAISVSVCWASGQTILSILDELHKAVHALSDPLWKKTYKIVNRVSHLTNRYGNVNRAIDHERVVGKVNSPKVASLISTAFVGDEVYESLYNEILRGYGGDDKVVLTLIQKYAIISALKYPSKWERFVRDIKFSYERGVVNDPVRRRPYYGKYDTDNISDELAREVTNNVTMYPNSLLSVMESTAKRKVGVNARSVRDISDTNDWFEELEF